MSNGTLKDGNESFNNLKDYERKVCLSSFHLISDIGSQVDESQVQKNKRHNGKFMLSEHKKIDSGCLFDNILPRRLLFLSEHAQTIFLFLFVCT